MRKLFTKSLIKSVVVVAIAALVTVAVVQAHETFWSGKAHITIEAPLTERKGDFDNDGDVDIFDFVLFAAAYGSESGDPNYNPVGDFDDDDCINILDFVSFAGAYGT